MVNIFLDSPISEFYKKVWIFWRKLRFLMLPTKRRVRLEISADGRHLPFLLVSLAETSYGLHVVGSPMVFRELLALRHSARIPFVIGGKSRLCEWAIGDSEQALMQVDLPRKLLLNYDYFGPSPSPPRMPYFMHPTVYAKGLHQLPPPDPGRLRPVRIGFFGSRDAEFYTRYFHHPILDREQILAAFLSEFHSRIWTVDAPVSDWRKTEIAVSIDHKGGDRAGKSFLPMVDYLAALRKCDFFLSPPGWCMPFSHNLIEGMAAGCIPILNYPDFLDPALEDGVNCFRFRSLQDFRQVIQKALEIPPGVLHTMRRNVMLYYARHLNPGKWLRGRMECDRPFTAIRVNAEEISMAIAAPEVSFSK